jgi:hypothetical protein
VTAAAATATLDFRRGFTPGPGGIGETYTFGWVASLEIVGVRVASVVSVRTRVRLMGRGAGGTLSGLRIHASIWMRSSRRSLSKSVQRSVGRSRSVAGGP